MNGATELKKGPGGEKQGCSIFTVVWIVVFIIAVSLVSPNMDQWIRIVGFILIGIWFLSLIGLFIKTRMLYKSDEFEVKK